ncbi:MAG: MoaD/ThiS family protein [Anaerolineae bacterium]|nr:MoaD/ThiS family protein [Anaerolineae bacterium]
MSQGGSPEGRVRVELHPWLSEQVSPGHTGVLVLEEPLPAPGRTLRDLLVHLAVRYEGAARHIYDAQAGVLREGVLVAHNGRLLPSLRDLDVPLSPGDTVALIPAYPGG